MNTAEIAILRNSMLFSLTRRAWSNRRQADKSKIVTTADKSKLNLTKQLLVSAELDAITDHMNEVYNWCMGRAMPSATRRGIYFVRRDMVAEFEAALETALTKLQTELVPAFLRNYLGQCEEMRTKLGDFFDERDYPGVDVIEASFSIEWSWLALSVPNELPEEVREREVAKLRQSYADAQTEIRQALRTGFKDLVDHAVERLTPATDGTPKVFRNSLINNFNEFFDTFHARNLMDDAELAGAVSQARQILSGINPEALRTSDDIRQQVIAGFQQVAALTDGLVVVSQNARRFSLDDAA